MIFTHRRSHFFKIKANTIVPVVLIDIVNATPTTTARWRNNKQSLLEALSIKYQTRHLHNTAVFNTLSLHHDPNQPEAAVPNASYGTSCRSSPSNNITNHLYLSLPPITTRHNHSHILCLSLSRALPLFGRMHTSTSICHITITDTGNNTTRAFRDAQSYEHG